MNQSENTIQATVKILNIFMLPNLECRNRQKLHI